MCEISDVMMTTTCMNVICSNRIVSMVFQYSGLTLAYDILPHNGSHSYSLKGVMLRKL